LAWAIGDFVSVKRFLSHLTAEQLVSGKRPKGRLERQHKYLGRYKAEVGVLVRAESHISFGI
jgi:Na+-transporting NADH:ubiquinone oxidoreductase subunit NqrA